MKYEIQNQPEKKIDDKIVTFDELDLTDRYTLLKSLPKHYINALEIGVWHGWYTSHIICATTMNVVGVDPWHETESYGDVDKNSEDFNPFAKGSDGYLWQEARYVSTIDALSVYPPVRYKIVRSFSHDYVNFIRDEHFDFIYIDGEHTSKGVRRDIEDWWPKVKLGGILAGHDYVEGPEVPNYYGVKQVVDEFAEKNNLEFKVTGVTPGSGDGGAPSWCIIKNKATTSPRFRSLR